MKKILLASVAAAAFCGAPVLAADMPVKAPPAPAPAVWNWTGFYVGADIGGAWGRDDVSPVVADGGTFPRTNRLKTDGVFGGGTIGYNIQSGSFVSGIEVDLGDMSIGKTQRDLLGGTETSVIKGGFYGDVTGRLGFAVNNALVYAKGGWAFFDGRAHQTTGIGGFTITNTKSFDGWTLGAGVEYRINPAWSLKVEYQYFDFGSQNALLTSGAGVFPYKNDLTVNTVKVGLNYMFGSGGKGPVVAKY